MLDLISDFGEWVLSLVELATGRIDPRVKAAWAYVAAAAGVVIPAFGAWRALKTARAWSRGEKTDITDKDAEDIARDVVSKAIDYDKLAEAIVRKQAALAASPVSEADITAARRGIAHVAETAATGDAEQRRIADALAAGDSDLAVRLLGARLETKARAGATMNKEAAEAARGIAALKRLTNVSEAASLYRRAADLEPDGIETWADAADTALEAGRLGQARQACEKGLAAAERNQDARWRMALSNRLGDICVAEGALDEAMAFYGNAKEVSERLANSDPGNAGWQRDFSVANGKIGDVLVEQGNLSAALESYRATLAISERLANSDPGNAGWQRDFSLSQVNIGDVLRAQGSLTAALESYRASLAISERLANSDPGNAGWQFDVGICNERIGDVLFAQVSLSTALRAYETKKAIIERLVNSDPGNAGWQRDLSVSNNKIGDVLVEQGNLSAALESYRASLAISERLANSDPGNAGWQHDVALSLQRLGHLAASAGESKDALGTYRRGLAIMQRLAALAPDHASFKRDLAWFQARIAELEGN